VFAKAAVAREEARTAAATFERDYIPDSSEVAEQEKALLEAGLIAGLEQVEAAWDEHCAEVRGQ
jgi:hypothetical protein